MPVRLIAATSRSASLAPRRSTIEITISCASAVTTRCVTIAPPPPVVFWVSTRQPVRPAVRQLSSAAASSAPIVSTWTFSRLGPKRTTTRLPPTVVTVSGTTTTPSSRVSVAIGVGVPETVAPERPESVNSCPPSRIEA